MPAPPPTPVRSPAPGPVAGIPALESVRPAPARPPRAPVDGPPPAPADFDKAGMWEQVVAHVLQKKRMLGHFLEAARPLGWQGDVLVLEVDPAHRGLIEHRDNRAPLVAAVAVVFGRPLVYRAVDRAPGSGGPVSAPQGVQNVQSVQSVQPAPPKTIAAPPREEAPEEPPPLGDVRPQAQAQRKHPAELSPEARNTMLWLEGEIVGPNPPSSRGPTS
jgi:hypothetical protein